MSGRAVSQSQNSWYCSPRQLKSRDDQKGNTHPSLPVDQVRVRPAPHAEVRQPLTHARERVAAQGTAERGTRELLDLRLALELRLDVAELLLAVDHLGVVALERGLDGVQLGEIAHCEAALEVVLHLKGSASSLRDIALEFHRGEFHSQEGDRLQGSR